MKVVSIFGPPGTGKTRTLVDIAVREAERTGGKVTYLSFTKAAAAEAVARIAKGNFGATGIYTSTLHSLAFNALSMNRASVVDAKKLAEFGRDMGIPFKGSEPGSDEPQEGDHYATVLEYAENKIIDVWEAYEAFGRPGTKHKFELFFKSYADWKSEFGFMDFNDMLTRYTQDDSVKANGKDVVILDEAQDCSPLQWLAFLKATRDAKRVYIAGDDDQAIYEWNGADPHGMINFTEESDGEVRILDQSHRVPRRVLNLATESCLLKIGARVNKMFAPRAGNDGHIERFGDIWDLDLHKWSEDGGLILVRDRFRSEELRRMMNQELIPYRVLGGFSPWTSPFAESIRNGDKTWREASPMWQDFYRQADLKQEIKVQLSTIHQAKGRESARVILDLSLSATVLEDLYRRPDPELRVLYVALTRTSDQLILCGENPLL